MRIIRHASLVPVPWKNGGGITREAIRLPAGEEPFRWRVSIAQIDASGPFSHFPGYRRTMVLLRGSGLRLRFAAGPDIHLREVGELTSFDGGVAAECDLSDGPCTDLNLMVAASSMPARVRVERLTEPRALRPALQGTVLAFVIDGAVELAGDHESARLLPWDSAVLGPGEGGIAVPQGCAAGPSAPDDARPLRDPPAAPLVFFAALDDNSA